MTRNYKLDWLIANEVEPLSKRDVRALTQGHRISNGGGDGEFVVESLASGSSYHVDLRRGACDCPDADGDGSTICKHQRAAQFATGMRPIPPTALRLDEIAVDVIRDGDNNVVDLNAVDDYKQIRLETDSSVDRMPRWATEDGEIVSVDLEPAAEPDPVEIERGREIVAENSQQPAADGGETCGSTDTVTSEPCENPVSGRERCHLHRESDDAPEPEQAQQSTADADAVGLVADGGLEHDHSDETISETLASVLDELNTDDRPIIVVVGN